MRPAAGLAAEPHEDDGLNPRDERAGYSRRPSVDDRKALQLCKEAERALQMALAGECGDPLLNDLEVVSVMPGAGNRLHVSVRPSTKLTPEVEAQVLRRLVAASGFLRAEVANAVVRRRAPELRFTLLRGGGEP